MVEDSASNVDKTTATKQANPFDYHNFDSIPGGSHFRLNLIRTAIQSLRSGIIIIPATAFLLLLGEYQVSTGTAHAQAQDPIMKIFFIDVQGGSSSLVILPNGKTLLIDGGLQSTGGEIIVKLLQEQNITKVDTIVGTHLHRDHVGGLIDVLKNFPVGEVLDPGINDTGYPYDEFISAIKSSNAQYKAVREGDEIILDPSVKIEVMNPPTSLAVGVDASFEDNVFLNNFSVVIKLSYGGFDILFPGDILSGIQQRFLDKDIDVEVLVAPHHGTPHALNVAFLQTASPEVAILSPEAGTEEDAIQETFDKLEFMGTQEIVNTRLEGTTMLVTDGHTHRIESLGTGRTFVIPEFNSIQIIFIIGLGIILMPILFIQYRKLWARNNKNPNFPI
jgi:beta-lactamase superfamily II metal-dependent hydrolase